MDLPRVDSCCFGLTNLKTGTLIVAIFCLFVSFTPGAVVYNGGGIWPILQGILIVACIVVSILLIVGVLQNNANFVKYFVIVWVIDIIYTIVLTFVFIFSRNYDPVSGIIALVLYVLVIGYCTAVVNSYFATLTGESAISA